MKYCLFFISGDDPVSQSLNGIQRINRMPYGGGEQNMVTFVPNIVALKYLACTDQVNPELRDNTTNVKNMHLHRDSNPGPWNTVPML